MGFEYISTGELDSQLFFTMPKELLRGEQYRDISAEAKLLYVVMSDRQKLSAKNGWADEEDHVFIYYTLDEICRDMNVSRKTAAKLLNELENKAFLILRHRQGFGKPNRIYVGSVRSPEKSPDGNFMKCKKETTESVESTLQEVHNGNPNNNDKNKNDMNKNESIKSICTDDADPMDVIEPVPCQIEEREALRGYFEEQCGFSILREEEPANAGQITEIEELLIETCSSKSKMIRIGGEEKNRDIVKGQLMKLDSEHIRYVLACLAENTTEVRNIRQYLLTSLYNAPHTISNYYRAKVNHDLYGSGRGWSP